ncbi:MmcQ/YjbR family DNA-binding protein [Nonlabens ponticola]|uniref:MmcQ/YjbR family DNA-binding protein n=1 Tax=Nonlabens ponticola TaxID=2496866 RepID=A0A3S9MUP4_9FLAO|nr:MmcQ/YjbR family DNA-binding protein [Nonlabens ponticola]AZQ42873.1 MmcQ/YjbR family DNA-binding protein [Nonlabens ponticola]
MQIDELQDYCLTKEHTTVDMPFDNTTLVFKVMGKMFALTRLTDWEKDQPTLNVKCDPEKAIELREQYDGVVTGGYHMSKKHWNTIKINDVMPDAEIFSWIDHSYELVVASLTAKQRATFK